MFDKFKPPSQDPAFAFERDSYRLKAVQVVDAGRTTRAKWYCGAVCILGFCFVAAGHSEWLLSLIAKVLPLLGF